MSKAEKLLEKYICAPCMISGFCKRGILCQPAKLFLSELLDEIVGSVPTKRGIVEYTSAIKRLFGG